MRRRGAEGLQAMGEGLRQTTRLLKLHQLTTASPMYQFSVLIMGLDNAGKTTFLGKLSQATEAV